MNQSSLNPSVSGKDVFVSYASQDAAVANAIVAALEANGVTCWVAPRDVRPGAAYAEAIVRAINDASAFVLVLSGAAMASEHVSREVERAGSKHKQIIAFKVDAVPLSAELEYFLSRSQWIDVAALGMPAALARLAEAVGQGAARTLPADSAVGTVPRAGVPKHGHGLPLKLPFLEQIKRRNVGRVAILYVGVCYLILEFFSTFLHVLALPEWTGRTLAALMVAGFPVVLLLSWIFELTPQGIKPAAQVDVSPSSRKLTGRRLDFAIIVVLVLALGYFAADKFWLSKHAVLSASGPEAAIAAVSPGAQVVSVKSIAVLPFTDMSQKKDQEYFGDGMAEEIIDLLVKIPQLKVVGRTSSFQFKGKTDDLRKIGEALGAAYIVEGSVRRAGDHLRISAQLIDSRDGIHRWSNTYDREAVDVLKIQDEIAANLVRALQLEMTGSDLHQNRPAPKSSAAYDAYLRGLHAINRFDESGFNEAAVQFQQTLTLDPAFVPAMEQLARTYCDQGSWGTVPPHVAYELARAAAMTALRSDPSSAIAHTILGCVNLWYDWDWKSAHEQLQLALQREPGNPLVLVFMAEERMAVGDWDAAVELCRKAVVSEPLLATPHQNLRDIYVRQGQYSDAERAIRRALEISPTFGGAHQNLSVVLVLKKQLPLALDEAQREQSPGERMAAMALAYSAMNRRREADSALAELEQKHAGDKAYYIAEILAYQGRIDEAFRWLERAYEQKDIWLWSIKRDPLLRNLERDPRYKAFLKKMNLPE